MAANLVEPRTAAQTRAHLRGLTERRQAMIVPGAANALNARIIEDLGFEAVYITGAGLANTILGLPDIGLLTATELAEATSRIADICSLPLLVDIDTGFGNAVNVYRTVQMMERAGASALQIEDQVFPKKCGHFSGKAIAPLNEMVGKIKAALDARRDGNLQIIARTDVLSVEGLDAAMERAQAFIAAGADMIFVEAPQTVDDIRRVAELPVPQVMNIVIGGKTPMLPLADLKAMNFSVVLYANAVLQATILATQEVLGHLKRSGSLLGLEHRMADFDERQRVVAKGFFDELEKRYAEP